MKKPTKTLHFQTETVRVLVDTFATIPADQMHAVAGGWSSAGYTPYSQSTCDFARAQGN